MLPRLFLLLLCVAVTASAQAAIWRVDANTANQADFRTLQDVHDSADVAAGDTLYVAGFSGTDYGSLIATKPLAIFGPGYFLDENPETQALPAPATMQALEFADGSGGSLMSGMTIEGVVTIRTEEVTLRRNRITNLIAVEANRATLLQNHITRQRATAIDIMDSQNVIIEANFIEAAGGAISAIYAIQSAATSSAQVRHNVVFTSATENGLLLHNAVVENNILRSGPFNGTGNDVRNNLANADQFGTEDGNQANVDMGAVFVGADGTSTDGQWQLRAGSPAAGAGVDGVDAGMFGGASPYVLSGLPDLPRIYFFSAASVGSAEDGLQVRVKVRSGN